MTLMKLHCLVALLVLAPRALASDWYVDAVNGSNSNSGTSAGDAWLTITHALQQIGAAADTIHLLPGTYDTALGETFPLQLTGCPRIVGDAGPDETRVECDPGSDAFLGDTSTGFDCADFEGITIAGASTGIHIVKPGLSGVCISLDVRNAVFEGCGKGVDYECWYFGYICNHIDMEDVKFLGGQWGVRADHAEFDDLHMSLTRCTFVGQSVASMFQSAGTECEDTLFVGECRFEGAHTAIRTTTDSSGQLPTGVGDTVIANCTNGISTSYAITLWGSTVTGTTNEAASGYGGFFWILDSNLFANGTDLGTGTFTVSDTNLGGGGPLVGQNGNISVDPLFRDPEHGDYRLGWGTGCVDAVAAPIGSDHSGFPRGNDGDLDLAGAGDMGAFELRTLDMPETLAIGQKLHIDYFAETGTFGALYLARTKQLPAPLATPFGEQWLPTNFLELVGMQKALSPHPMRRTIPIPEVPALVGQQFSFQALSRSSNAPQGAAWTDAATVTFTL